MLSPRHKGLGLVIGCVGAMVACNGKDASKNTTAGNQTTTTNGGNAVASSGSSDPQGHLSLTMPTMDPSFGTIGSVVISLMPAPSCYSRHPFAASTAVSAVSQPDDDEDEDDTSSGSSEGYDPSATSSYSTSASDPVAVSASATPPPAAVATSAPAATALALDDSAVDPGYSGSSASQGSDSSDGAPGWTNSDDDAGPDGWHQHYTSRHHMPFSNFCKPIMQTFDYAAGGSVSLDGVPVGEHLVLIAIVGPDGSLKEVGHGDAVVTSGGTSIANVTVHPVTQTGSLVINIQQCNNQFPWNSHPQPNDPVQTWQPKYPDQPVYAPIDQPVYGPPPVNEPVVTYGPATSPSQPVQAVAQPTTK